MIIYVPKGARVFIVEDNQERIDWFRWRLNDCHAEIVCLTDDPVEATGRLITDCDPSSLDALFFDFDLGHTAVLNNPEHPEQTTSMPIVEYLMNHSDVRLWDKNAVIHSQNRPGAQWIKDRLPRATVAPFGSFTIKEKQDARPE